MTAFDRAAGYFDHIYLGNSIAALDAINAAGHDKGEIVLSAEEVERHWAQLGSPDASVAYRSLWTLVAAGKSAEPILIGKLGAELERADDATVADWFKQLDHEEYAVREHATTKLAQHSVAAKSAMEKELQRTTSIEVRRRLETILAKAERPATEAERMEQLARRVLRVIAERNRR